MKRMLLLITLTTCVLGLAPGLSRPVLATWVDSHCYPNNYADSNVRRADAQAYATVGFDEGYEWGGGCWNDNDKDDTPGQPDSGGEGPDCSGYTFKTWELKNGYGVSGFRWWDKMQDQHGPYTTSDFHDVGTSSSLPFHRLKDKNRSTTLYMDAFAKVGHVGILYTSSNPTANTDWIAEALGDASGTGEFEEDFRYDSAYVAVRRKDWTPDCWPNCIGSPDGRVVVIG